MKCLEESISEVLCDNIYRYFLLNYLILIDLVNFVHVYLHGGLQFASNCLKVIQLVKLNAHLSRVAHNIITY